MCLSFKLGHIEMWKNQIEWPKYVYIEEFCLTQCITCNTLQYKICKIKIKA